MDKRLKELALELADEAARSDLECFCVWRDQGKYRWFQTTCQEGESEHQPIVNRAVEYLLRRGLIMRNSRKRSEVRLLNP